MGTDSPQERPSAVSEGHWQTLCQESAIRPEVIAERGYRTVTDAAELATLGFAPAQRRAPGLLIPVFGPDGSLALHQFRPDSPRQVTGREAGESPKLIKYETPAGAGMRLDVPPRCRPKLGDPKTPLWITEGVKKGDALASAGCCAVALLGVWNFKGKNEFGGTTLLADFDYIALDGREVRVVFDSDIVDKPGVRLATERLSEHLSRKGANVTTIHLPGGQEKKVGVDDYLREHSLEDLEKLVTAPRPAPRPAPATYTLLDEMPTAMNRPLQIVGDHAYAATWIAVRRTETEVLDKSGNVVRLNPPREETRRELLLVRDDCVVFGPGGDRPISEIGFDTHLPEVPPEARLMKARSVRAYRQGRRAEPVEVFGNVRAVIDRFIDFDRSLGDQDSMCELIACYILATWFTDAFNVAGYIWPTGERGSGKTQLLTLICELSYLGQLVLASGTMATLRDMADYGAFLGFDDAENLTNAKQSDPDKRTLLLAGNRRGSMISVKEPIPGEKAWRTRYVQTYSFRGFTATRTPDPILASRTITVPLVRTADRRKGNADVMDFSLWPHSRETLVGLLWMLALANLARMREYDAAAGERASLGGRNLEPWRAVLAVALWLEDEGVEGLFGRMEGLGINYQSERQELEKGDITALVLRALAGCVSPQSSEGIDANKLKASAHVQRIKTAAIVATARGIIEAEELDFDPEQVTTRTVGRTLGKLRFKSNKVGGGSKSRGWEVSTQELLRLLQSFSLVVYERPVLTSSTSSTSSCPLNGGGRGGHEDVEDIRDIRAEHLIGSLDGGTEDCQDEFFERAAIIEFDGGLTREEAERLASAELFRRSLASSNAA